MEREKGSERKSWRGRWRKTERASFPKAPVRATGQDQAKDKKKTTWVHNSRRLSSLVRRVRSSLEGRSEAASSSARTRAWNGKVADPTADLTRDLTTRFQKLKESIMGPGPVIDQSSLKESALHPRPPPPRTVSWADDHGAPLCTSWLVAEVPSPSSFFSQGVPANPPSYKETLLRDLPLQNRLEHHKKNPASRTRPLDPKKRCFRCLASDHRVRNCQDPLRWALCLRTGHRARHCRLRTSPTPTRMLRGGDFRPHVAKVFIPLYEDFHKRQLQRQRAVLADVIGRANLGHFPQETIASDLAARFRGFSTDFLVAKHFDRDYVILLPEWVRPETIVINELLRLEHCRLRCLEWDPYRHASLSRLMYTAWIKLEHLPFECWSEKCVTSMVHDFGRYIRADANSINLVDLTGFKCLIAVDDLTDIPKHLSISLGDHVVSARSESKAPRLLVVTTAASPSSGVTPARGGGIRRIPGAGCSPGMLGPPRRAKKTGAPGRAFARATRVPGILRSSKIGVVLFRWAGRWCV